VITSGPANLQRVPSPLLYVGRRGGVPFVSGLAVSRLACASIAYLVGVSATRPESGGAGVSAGRLRRTQDGFPRVCQDGALRALPTLYLAAAQAEPAETAAQRLGCVSSTYAGLPTAAAAEAAALRLAATGRVHLAAASASLVESVTVRTAATGRAYVAAGIRAASRVASQRLACVSATYSPA
jgi:hypothetical protein